MDKNGKSRSRQHYKCVGAHFTSPSTDSQKLNLLMTMYGVYRIEDLFQILIKGKRDGEDS